ncbi:hypothetical protein ACJRO7_009175 [Eucalyptus globulus]|uniref:Protein kinase domain-containing protein n=1 Tax=Eucalyptus globulus TaxID=34317 RepID=A0ABD3IUT9_EUCGL
MSVLARSFAGGKRIYIQQSLLKLIVISCLVISIIFADSNSNSVQASPISPSGTVSTPAIPDLSPPKRSPHRQWQRRISPQAAPVLVLSPGHPPHSDPLITSGHPPTSSRLSKPSMKRSSLVPPSASLADIAPTQSSPATVPSALAEPPLSHNVSNCCQPDMVLKRDSKDCHCVYPIKLDLLLLNVSQNPDWKVFLQDFAKQLGLQASQIELINFYVLGFTRLNISMDITPQTGLSFSASDAYAINSSLSLHQVHLSPSLVGDYKLLNITWFKAPPPSEAPIVATSPPVAQPHQPTPKASNPSDGAKHSSLVIIICIGAGIAMVIVIMVLIICACTSRRGKTEASKEISPTDIVKPRTPDSHSVGGSLPHPSSTRVLAYEELKKATDNFARESILGEGGFGRVFKGVLSDGTAVAIKRLTSGGQQGDKEFLVEVEMLSRLHHRNLVKLVGYYSSPESSQNLLCYELVRNGSLESWLHGPLGVNCPLDWDTRMKIALDAARGLAYLHEDSQPCVIHRDFKASNILLENNFHAKVADFGLAKQAPEGRTNYLSTRVMGTFGYVAPEYAMTGHLLVKSDVYSYGVVLLELLTGRKPVDMAQPSGQENLVTWVT